MKIQNGKIKFSKLEKIIDCEKRSIIFCDFIMGKYIFYI